MQIAGRGASELAPFLHLNFDELVTWIPSSANFTLLDVVRRALHGIPGNGPDTRRGGSGTVEQVQAEPRHASTVSCVLHKDITV